MSVEKSSANLFLKNQKNLSDYERKLREQPVRRRKNLGDAIKFINSTSYDQPVKDIVVSKLQGYPSRAIDMIFANIPAFLKNTEIQLSVKTRNLNSEFKKNKKVQEKINAADLLDNLEMDENVAQEETTQEIPEVPVSLPMPEVNPENEFFKPEQSDEF